MPFDFMENKVVGIAGRGAAERENTVVQVGNQVFRLGDKATRDREKGYLFATQKVPVNAPVVGTPMFVAPARRVSKPVGLGSIAPTPDQSWWARAYNWGVGTAAEAATRVLVGNEGVLETTGDMVSSRLSQVKAAANARFTEVAQRAGVEAAKGAERQTVTTVFTYILVGAIAYAVYTALQGRRRR
jgi:hypothetical protein